MAPRPNVIVQLRSREKVAELRAGIGDTLGIVALGPETEGSWRMSGIDAFYLSVTRAERWGAKPIPPHTVAVLRTSDADQAEGFPPFILTGFLLRKGDPDTAAFGLPRLVTSLLGALEQVNADQPGAIRTIGFFEFELTFKGTTLADVGRLLAESFEAVTR